MTRTTLVQVEHTRIHIASAPRGARMAVLLSSLAPAARASGEERGRTDV